MILFMFGIYRMNEIFLNGFHDHWYFYVPSYGAYIVQQIIGVTSWINYNAILLYTIDIMKKQIDEALDQVEGKTDDALINQNWMDQSLKVCKMLEDIKVVFKDIVWLNSTGAILMTTWLLYFAIVCSINLQVIFGSIFAGVPFISGMLFFSLFSFTFFYVSCNRIQSLVDCSNDLRKTLIKLNTDGNTKVNAKKDWMISTLNDFKGLPAKNHFDVNSKFFVSYINCTVQILIILLQFRISETSS